MADSNVDSILIPREQAMLAEEKIPAAPVEIKVEHEEPKPDQALLPDDHSEKVEDTSLESKPDQEEDKAKPTKPADETIDEYGNPIEAPKMYSEEEVQTLIRERLKRTHRHEEPTHKDVKEAAKDFKADPESEETWEDQLGQFIDKRLEQREKQFTQKQWQQQESQRQAEFESKFTTGMNKYSDFHKVVSGKPVTDTMMLATRTLDNPAAFIYGAAKMHPQELDRIARISDPYTQAAEVGRLHERMVKESKRLSTSPKPIDPPRGDLPNKVLNNQPSLEDRIHSYAKQKRK